MSNLSFVHYFTLEKTVCFPIKLTKNSSIILILPSIRINVLMLFSPNIYTNTFKKWRFLESDDNSKNGKPTNRI